MKRLPLALIILVILFVAALALLQAEPATAPTLPPETLTATPCPLPSNTPTPTVSPTATLTPTPTLHPLSIEYLRDPTYAAEIQIVETLERGANYERYYVSYESEGNTIYALLTIPDGEAPETGWPVIIFNHGYIPPDEYVTTERYIAYVDAFARSGYMVLRSDYRGHDRSEGVARGTYRYPDYVIDVLNATAAMKVFPDADPNRIGMWGHSMGGYITLRAMVVDPDIKAGVIWAGVVAPYDDLDARWFRSSRGAFLAQYGTPDENPAFWESISAHYYLDDLSGPLQLHHGTADTSVPYEFSQSLYSVMLAGGHSVELYLYDGDDHNLANEFIAAMGRSLSFFYFHVKGEN
ncbi:MAG: alpha/beta fold hydrolase [Anaerolineae bacterium]|nr:MAG: alpha/beta fold hydrolase [Anaerolineae bacterium]